MIYIFVLLMYGCKVRLIHDRVQIAHSVIVGADFFHGVPGLLLPCHFIDQMVKFIIKFKKRVYFLLILQGSLLSAQVLLQGRHSLLPEITRDLADNLRFYHRPEKIPFLQYIYMYHGYPGAALRENVYKRFFL